MNNDITIQFAATPVNTTILGKQSFVLQGNERNAYGGVHIEDSGVECVMALDIPVKGGTHWITITRDAARKHNIMDEKEV